ncbi:MAG: type II toxin-antitoxin system Phd/YefM family antitoxin [Caldilineaceae bacterium]|jgi:prevent-host-death family protein|nr:type II toxin-antitoxin system Phd/YefM family antitoxin [Caldilineaceae bacterium]
MKQEVKQEIGVRELKNRLTAIMREVRETGAEYTVTLHGEPVAVIRPLPSLDEDARATIVEKELLAITALAARISAGGEGESLRKTLETMREESEWR